MQPGGQVAVANLGQISGLAAMITPEAVAMTTASSRKCFGAERKRVKRGDAQRDKRARRPILRHRL
jgi:hypothetical protein